MGKKLTENWRGREKRLLDLVRSGERPDLVDKIAQVQLVPTDSIGRRNNLGRKRKKVKSSTDNILPVQSKQDKDLIPTKMVGNRDIADILDEVFLSVISSDKFKEQAGSSAGILQVLLNRKMAGGGLQQYIVKPLVFQVVLKENSNDIESETLDTKPSEPPEGLNIAGEIEKSPPPTPLNSPGHENSCIESENPSGKIGLVTEITA